MKKYKCWLFFGLGLLLGAITIGLCQHYLLKQESIATAKYFENILKIAEQTQTMADITMDVEVLMGAQLGKTNYLIETGEIRLVGHVRDLDEAMPVDVLLSNSNALRRLDKVANYHDQFPFRPENSEAEGKLNEFLTRVQQKRLQRGF